MNKYEAMTQDDFHDCLQEIVDKTYKKPSNLLSIPGVYEVLVEEFNNDVLDLWEEKNHVE